MTLDQNLLVFSSMALIGRLSRKERIEGNRNYYVKNATNNEFTGTRRIYPKHLIYVTSVRRFDAKLTYTYEQDPGWTQADLLNFKAYPPLFVGSFTTAGTAGTPIPNINVVHDKYRLKEITASTLTGDTPRTVSIHYRSHSNLVCPNLISYITSPHATNTRVDYSYERYQYTAGIHSMDQCRLIDVKLHDNSHWQFAYGPPDGNGAEFGSAGTAVDDYSQLYMPIAEVKTPTGAKVKYEYIALGVCEYQDVFKQRISGTYSDPASCESPEYRRRAVSRRTIELDGEDSVWHQINYLHEPWSSAGNEVQREIVNAERTHLLTYGRIDRKEAPTVSTLASGRRLYSGRLKEHVVKVTGGSQNVFSHSTYHYLENQGFIDFSSINYPSYRLLLHVDHHGEEFWTDNPNYGYEAGRWKFLYDAVRINHDSTTTIHNGSQFVTRRRDYNEFNQPTYIDESQDGTERRTKLVYATTPTTEWIVGLVAEKQITNKASGAYTELSLSKYTYNSDGQLVTETVNGFPTTYTYLASGDLATVTDGEGNTTTYSDYQNGVPFKIWPAAGGFKRQWSFADGLVHQITDAAGKTVKLRYDSMGRVTQRWTGFGSGPKTTVSHPNWNVSGHARRMQETRSDLSRVKSTYYDALGRVTKVAVSGQSTVYTVYSYDDLGRLTFVSDPSDTDHGSSPGNWPGTTIVYDPFDRVIRKEHSHATQPVKICYGPSCNSISEFTLAGGTVGNGYVVKDEAGNLSVHNFRSLGQPGYAEPMEIVQQIDGSSTVETTLERNIHGFIEKVTQGNTADGYKTRQYWAYVKPGSSDSLSPLIYKEDHPEFGLREVTEFDNAGNVTEVVNYSGTTLTYTYTPLNQVDTIATSDNSYDANFDYYPNGSIMKIVSDGTTLDYTYQSGKDLLASEKLSLDGQQFTLSYDYNGFDELTRITYPNATVVDYTLNGLAQASAVAFGDGSATRDLVSNATYFPNGQLKTATYSNGQVFTSTQNTLSLPENWGFDKPDRSNATLSLTYTYDPRRNVKKIQNYFEPYTTGAKDISNMTYDGLNRLTSATGRWGTAAYSYDAYGNIMQKVIDGNLQHENTQLYTYDTAKLLLTSVSTGNNLSTPSRSFTYDLNGNAIDNGSASMTYDEMGRMTGSTRPSATLANRFDGNNHRVKASVTKDGTTKTTYYLYSSAGDLLYEKDQESGEERTHLLLNGKSVATLGSHQFHDTDSDGIPDYYERLHGMNANEQSDGNDDTDGDGLSNQHEYLLGSAVMSTDTDDDGLPDAWEYEYQLDLSQINGASTDADGDGISDYAEYIAGSNPSEHLMSRSVQMYLVPVIHMQSF